MQVYRTDAPGRKPGPQDDGAIDEGALDETAAAKFLGCGKSKLLEMRRDGNAPPYYRIGNRVRYPKHQLVAWMDAAVAAAVPVWPRRKPAEQAEEGVA